MKTDLAPYISRTMTVSTAHVTRQDMETLAAVGAKERPRGVVGDGLVAYSYAEGVFIVVHERGFDAANFHPRLSAEFTRLYKAALDAGCDMLRLDADYERVPGFKTFDW